MMFLVRMCQRRLTNNRRMNLFTVHLQNYLYTMDSAQDKLIHVCTRYKKTVAVLVVFVVLFFYY